MLESKHISFVKPLEALQPITLEEMEGIKLMNRIDSKYLTDEATLLHILDRAAEAGYRVLVTEGMRISPYESVYYDTAGLRMFYDHHNRRLVRQKVRTRSYVNSGDTFLEIKRKNNKGRTKKKRMGIPAAELMDFRADEAACTVLRQPPDRPGGFPETARGHRTQAGRPGGEPDEKHPPGPSHKAGPREQILHCRHPYGPSGQKRPF